MRSSASGQPASSRPKDPESPSRNNFRPSLGTSRQMKSFTVLPLPRRSVPLRREHAVAKVHGKRCPRIPPESVPPARYHHSKFREGGFGGRRRDFTQSRKK